MSCSSLSCKLYQGDCFEWLKKLPDASVDFVCTDLPYGSTNAKWDCKIDLQALWGELKRVAKLNAAFAVFGAGKFSFSLANSNFSDFRYRYCWFKLGNASSGFLNANRRPLNASEDILLFYRKQPTYNPQRMLPRGGGAKQYIRRSPFRKEEIFTVTIPRVPTVSHDGLRFPTDVLQFKALANGTRVHSAQKPVDLLEFLVKTYTNEHQVVLDPFMGSGSCGVACMNTGRTFIGMEKDPKFFGIAAERLKGDLPPEYSFELFKP